MKNTRFFLLLIIAAFSCHSAQPGQEYFDAGIKKVEHFIQDSVQRRRDYESALLDFNKAIEINPAYADAYERRAYIRRGLDDFAGGLKDAEKAMVLDPSKTKLVYNFIGQSMYIKKDYIAAVKAYTKAIATDPEFSDAYYHRAQAEIELKDDVDALRDLNKAIETMSSSNPSLKYMYSMRGYLKKDMNDKSGACADFHKALELGLTDIQSVISDNCK
ncbi:MAG: tetratricopeptide repeat protein [Mucilaginibacter sp.]